MDVQSDMQVDGEPAEKQKVSTSGPRLSRRESYRADKKFMIRLPRSEFSCLDYMAIVSLVWDGSTDGRTYVIIRNRIPKQGRAQDPVGQAPQA